MVFLILVVFPKAEVTNPRAVDQWRSVTDTTGGRQRQSKLEHACMATLPPPEGAHSSFPSTTTPLPLCGHVTYGEKRRKDVFIHLAWIL